MISQYEVDNVRPRHRRRKKGTKTEDANFIVDVPSMGLTQVKGNQDGIVVLKDVNRISSTKSDSKRVIVINYGRGGGGGARGNGFYP